jgi:hypothetical protein
MSVPHGGGLKLRETDDAYTRLAAWIESGCPAPSLSDVATAQEEVVSIAAGPLPHRFTWPDWTSQLSVIAKYRSGRELDITHLAIFSSSDPRVATVGPNGDIQGVTRGEATVMVRYLDWIDTVDVSFDQTVKGLEVFVWPDITTSGPIDQIVYQRLQELKIPPSPLCSDNEYVRRTFLTVLGLLPTRREAEAFIADQRPDKRSRLVDELLGREEYAQFWGQKRGDLLRVTSSRLGVTGVQQVHGWLVDSVAENRPLDEFVSDLLTATGKTSEVPAANLFRSFANESELAEGMSQLLLGIRIQCAKCHNHPSDRWSQDNYYGLSAIFNRVQRVAIEGEDGVEITTAAEGEVSQPRTGKIIPPWVPGDGDLVVSADQDRRVVFARWLAADDNPLFASVAANRIWSEVLGRGIVEPVDDFRADNPPSHPELLDHLAQQLIRSGFDQKALIREILNSRIYQHSSRTLPLNENDEKYFSHARARLLDAEPLLDAISQVTGSPTRFALPRIARATQLPTPEFGTDFLKVFGQPNRNTVCECERSGDPKLAQSLQLINGDVIPQKLRDSNGRLRSMLYDVSSRVTAAGTPAVDGLVGWFAADWGVFPGGGGESELQDGDPVETWANRVEPKKRATQATASMRPVYRRSGLHGLPAIEFDGQDDFLHNAGVSLVSAGSPRTVIVVGHSTDQVGGALFTFGRQRTGGSRVFTTQHVVINGKVYVYSDGVDGAGNTTIPLADFGRLSSPFVTTYLSTGANAKLRVRLNGVDLATSQAGGVGADTGAIGFTIGSREDIPVAQQIWNGKIAEVLIYNRSLDEKSMANVGTYLTTKYDLDATYAKRPFATDTGVSVEDVLFDFYWSALSRPPSPRELQIAREHIAGCKTRERGLEDVAWALLNSREFLFQH